MTVQSCRIPTPQQRRFLEIRERAEKAMLAQIEAAIAGAAESVAAQVDAAGLDMRPTDRDYFMFAAQQVLFVRLCGGNPDTFEDGDAELGDRILSNGRHIVDHYWRRTE